MPEGCWDRSTGSLPSSAASAAINQPLPKKNPRPPRPQISFLRGSPIGGLRFWREWSSCRRGKNSNSAAFIGIDREEGSGAARLGFGREGWVGLIDAMEVYGDGLQAVFAGCEYL
jgi:hypothetical protein